MKRKTATFSIILTLAVFACLVFLPLDNDSQKQVFFKIEKGRGLKDIAGKLQEEGIIRWQGSFQIYALLGGYSKNLQAGTYLLSPSMNVKEIAEKIAEGKIILEKATVIEGWNLRDLGLYFQEKGMFSKEEFWNAAGYPLSPYSKEGYLFPDTYFFKRDASPKEVVLEMKENFQRKTSKLQFQESDLIMASILEKEVITRNDKEIVAGILYKRMEAGMPLQADATLTYITGKKSTKISKKETEIDSPYNTYKHYGLPPGPICNPGLESLEAALNPKESPFWYYLSSPEGETVFSRTLQEHNRAKAEHLGA